MASPLIHEFAAAKINLTLRVLGRRADGYHQLESLVAFALDTGDQLSLQPDPDLSLAMDGPEAAAIDGQNLIITVAERLRAEGAASRTGAFQLTKHLPVASGIGGGSADAAAAIRALARCNGIAKPDIAFASIAAGIGADIPVCIGGNGVMAAFMSGIGDKVWRPAPGPLLPQAGLSAVLVNPRVPVSTGAVFNTLAAPPLAAEPSDQPPAPFTSVTDCLEYVAASRNDLEAPAIQIAPVIAEVLAALRAQPACRMARMSGSGATCFALFNGMQDAERSANELQRRYPGWWVQATRLG
jgi:4-diphosphocytidyl-2-C-methyl-D-erythritol kinase